MPRKVFVSGSFDLLHSGHIAFLQQAAQYGDLYVALGSDATIYELKGRMPINNEAERLYMMQSV
ncbi:MAG: cytidyltransferase, partial [Chloroflexi bacterium]